MGSSAQHSDCTRRLGTSQALSHRMQRVEASMNSLPPELLGLIASFVYFRPRMRVLSILAKRWRTAVLRSVKRWPPYRVSYRPLPPIVTLDLDARPLFPELTSLRAACVTLDGWSTSVQSLELWTNAHWISDNPSKPDGLTSLTSLEISSAREPIGSADDCKCSANVALRNRTSLTALGIKDPSEREAAIFAETFPALQLFALRNRARDFAPMILPFLIAHSKQLTSLQLVSLRQGPLMEALIVLPFPILNDLRLWIAEPPRFDDPPDPTPQLEDVMKKYCHQLRKSALGNIRPQSSSTPSLLTLAAPTLFKITFSLAVPAIPATPELIAAFALCTHIEEIYNLDASGLQPSTAVHAQLAHMRHSPNMLLGFDAFMQTTLRSLYTHGHIMALRDFDSSLKELLRLAPNVRTVKAQTLFPPSHYPQGSLADIVKWLVTHTKVEIISFARCRELLQLGSVCDWLVVHLRPAEDGVVDAEHAANVPGDLPLIGPPNPAVPYTHGLESCVGVGTATASAPSSSLFNFSAAMPAVPTPQPSLLCALPPTPAATPAPAISSIASPSTSFPTFAAAAAAPVLAPGPLLARPLVWSLPAPAPATSCTAPLASPISAAPVFAATPVPTFAPLTQASPSQTLSFSGPLQVPTFLTRQPDPAKEPPAKP